MVFDSLGRNVSSIAAAIVWPVLVAAQSGTSVIAGAVKDASGAMVPGAQGHLVNEDTGVAFDTIANADGQYRIGASIPGTYRVEIVLDGFAPAMRRPLALHVSETLAVDVTLDLGTRAETIEVVASVPFVDSQSSNINETVTRLRVPRVLRDGEVFSVEMFTDG